MERDTVSPLAKLQQCMGILMVSFKLPDNHKILLIKKFLQSKQIQSWLMFYSRVVLAQFGFMKWEKKKKKCSVWSALFYLPSWVIVMAFYAEVLWHQMKTLYFTQASISNRGKSSNLTPWIKCKQKCDKIQPEENILKIVIIT